jgi:RNA helicase
LWIALIFGFTGDPNFKGKRNDIHVCADMIVKGCSLSDVAIEHPVAFARYHKGFTALKSIQIPKRTWKTKVLWYYGPTGTGKSYAANEEAGGEAYYKMGCNKWWDGYEGQEHVVIDDFRRDCCTFSELLRLCDQYPHRVEFKGGSCQFVAKCLWITANKPPKEMFVDHAGKEREDLGQLLRRLYEIKHFDVLRAGPGIGSDIIQPIIPRLESGGEGSAERDDSEQRGEPSALAEGFRPYAGGDGSTPVSPDYVMEESASDWGDLGNPDSVDEGVFSQGSDGGFFL